MKIRIPRSQWLHNLGPRRVGPACPDGEEGERPNGDGIDPKVKAGMAYLLLKNADLYRRLAE